MDTSSENEETESLCSIEFGLQKNFDVDIIGYFPDLDSMSIEEITLTGEKYAQLLLAVNKGLLSSKILKILEDRYKQTENTNEKLFIQNVVVFYGLLKEELNKIQNSNDPLVKPSTVFK